MIRSIFNNLKSQSADKKFKKYYVADRSVDLSKIGEYRNDAFPQSGPYCWLDRPNALIEVERKELKGELTLEQSKMCQKWIFDGYLIAENLLGDVEIDGAWAAYEKAIAKGVITVAHEPVSHDDPYPGRRLDPHMQIPEIHALLHHPKVIAITDLLFGRKTLPFQTIMGHKGSSQNPHSDSIHMTTYPLGYMMANWVAFENIREDSGPLEYFPRSHRLVPPLLSGELSISPLRFKKEGGSVYSQVYEPCVKKYIEGAGLTPSYFLAKKGDVLFWHANLIHGGAVRKNPQLSRKALVCHHFAEGAVTYHDLSGNHSRLHRNGIYTPPVLD